MTGREVEEHWLKPQSDGKDCVQFMTNLIDNFDAMDADQVRKWVRTAHETDMNRVIGNRIMDWVLVEESKWYKKDGKHFGQFVRWVGQWDPMRRIEDVFLMLEKFDSWELGVAYGQTKIAIEGHRIYTRDTRNICSLMCCQALIIKKEKCYVA